MGARKGERISPGYRYTGKLIFSEDFTIKNLSDSGICLETSQRILTNNIYRIQLPSKEEAGAGAKIIMKAEAVWSILRGTKKEKDDSLPVYEVGLKFIELTDEQKNILEGLIKVLSKKTVLP